MFDCINFSRNFTQKKGAKEEVPRVSIETKTCLRGELWFIPEKAGVAA